MSRAAVRHRVACVDGEIDDHLLDLAGVGADGAEPGAGADVELDVLAEQALQRAADLGDDRVQVERPRLEHLPAAEGEQLLRQLGGAVGSPLDLAEVAAKLDVAVRALEQQRGVAGDPGQQVVEVVGDAAGEPAEALELLRVQQLRLQPLPLGDVAEEGDVEAGEEVRSRGRLGDRTVPSLRCVSHSARIGPPARNVAQSSSTVASLCGGRNSSTLRPIRSRFATPRYSQPRD